MLRIVIAFIMMICLFFGALQNSNASDLCCIGKTEKDIKGVCVVKGIQDGRICMEDMDDGKSKACRGLSGCYQFKDLGSAEAGDRVIVTGWRAGDQKCYNGPNCGKVIVVGKGSTTHQPVKSNVSLPPPPLPEGVEGQQQGAPTASLPPPPQQPQPQAQPAPQQQESRQPVTQTIDSTLDTFKKVKDLFK
ncbi:MAG TPA: hypothetical protein PKZ54_10930 [Syntrophorhabdaceae bacterium]|nr:hypothetical protein [Syntrophorhabdaceae bacterium]